MAVVEVNRLDSQSLQTLLACLLAVLRCAVDCSASDLSMLIGDELVGKLGREEDLIALSCPLEPFSYEDFGILVCVCAVPECFAEF